MRKNTNWTKIEGRIYQHNLEIKQVKNQESANFGKDFISGTIEVAVDDNLTNIIPIHYTYVAPTYSSGKPNQTYHALEKILNGATIVTDGPEAALKVSCSPSVDVNDWYTDRNGTYELVSTKRLEGGFVNIVTSLNEDVSMRNQIKTDMLISSINRNEPENGPATVTIHGLIFNFRNEVMPVDYTVTNEAAMKFFESLDVSSAEPYYTEIRVAMNYTTQLIKKEISCAWGEPQVETVERKVRQWIVTGCNGEPYEFDDESTITAAEVQKALQDRQVKLANIKKQSEEYKAQKAAAPSTPAPQKAAPTQAVQTGGFTF